MNLQPDPSPPHREAAPPAPAPATSGYLSFRLGSEEYGIDILKVQEIRGYEPPTRLAGAPDFIKGVVNLRGVIVPIVDLRLKFGLAQPAYGGTTVVIILMIAGRMLGIVVDSVSDVVEFAPTQVRAAPAFNGRVEASHITGLGALRQGDVERLLILTDIEQLMSSPDMGLIGPGHAVH